MSSPIDKPLWSVLFYDDEFLAHEVTFAEALQCVLEELSEPFVDQGIQRYLSLFSISSEPRYFVERENDYHDNHYFAYAVADQFIEDGGIIADVRREIANNPGLNVNQASNSAYNLFQNIDLCANAFCDIPILSQWPENRVNHLEEFDPLLRQHLLQRYSAELAEGESVHAVFDKTLLTHLDDLHMWSFQQLFYFYSCQLGHYKGLEGKYGFENSDFRERIILSWGCAPHAHDHAYGIAFDIAGNHEVEDPLFLIPDFTLEDSFLAQIEALLR